MNSSFICSVTQIVLTSIAVLLKMTVKRVRIGYDVMTESHPVDRWFKSLLKQSKFWVKLKYLPLLITGRDATRCLEDGGKTEHACRLSVSNLPKASFPIATGSKALVCSRSLAASAGSNPAVSMDVCVL